MVYSFEGEGPKKQGAGGVGMWFVAALVMAFFGGITILILKQQNLSAIILVQPRQVSCPVGVRSAGGGVFEHCVAIDLPESGQWVRRNNLPGSVEVANMPNVQLRGCNNDVYELAKPVGSFSISCGYLEYRSTDGRARVVLEGYNPH